MAARTKIHNMSTYKAGSRPIWYIASPITHKDPNVVKDRLEAVSSFHQFLLKNDILAYSPHVHYHLCLELAEMNWEFWKVPSLEFLHRCDGMIVYMMDGYMMSEGIRAEVEYNQVTGKPVLWCPKESEVTFVTQVEYMQQVIRMKNQSING